MKKGILKFALVGMGFLAVAGILFLILAFAMKWDVWGALSSPVAIVCYAVVALAAIAIGALAIMDRIKGR